MFDSHIFEAVRNIHPSRRHELEITDAIQYLIHKRYVVTPHLVSGWWKDTGKLEDLLEANRLVLELGKTGNHGKIDSSSRLAGQVLIQRGARVVRSTIRGPAIIGEHSLIEDSFVGPFTSIYHHTRLRKCEIEHSIVLENTELTHIGRIEDSLIGQNARVSRSLSKPAAYRIMIGDSSQVEIP